jgi:hypothetical protein
MFSQLKKLSTHYTRFDFALYFVLKNLKRVRPSKWVRSKGIYLNEAFEFARYFAECPYKYGERERFFGDLRAALNLLGMPHYDGHVVGTLSAVFPRIKGVCWKVRAEYHLNRILAKSLEEEFKSLYGDMPGGD